MTTRVYYLGDLAQGVGPFGGLQWGPFLNAQQTQANVAALIEAIRKIDPLSWNGRDTGGPALRLYATTEKKGDPASDSPFAKLLELKLGGKK